MSFIGLVSAGGQNEKDPYIRLRRSIDNILRMCCRQEHVGSCPLGRSKDARNSEVIQYNPEMDTNTQVRAHGHAETNNSNGTATINSFLEF